MTNATPAAWNDVTPLGVGSGMNVSYHRTRLAMATVVSLLVLAVALVLGRADGSPDVADEIDTSKRISSASPATGPVVGDELVTLADGTYFGRITAAYVAPGEVVFDRRELLVGDDARAAADEDRAAADFAIRDTGLPRLVLPASDDTEVTVVECGDGGCVEGRSQAYGDFTRSFDDPTIDRERFFRVLVDGGVVVRIDEQYFA